MGNSQLLTPVQCSCSSGYSEIPEVPPRPLLFPGQEQDLNHSRSLYVLLKDSSHPSSVVPPSLPRRLPSPGSFSLAAPPTLRSRLLQVVSSELPSLSTPRSFPLHPSRTPLGAMSPSPEAEAQARSRGGDGFRVATSLAFLCRAHSFRPDCDPVSHWHSVRRSGKQGKPFWPKSSIPSGSPLRPFPLNSS